METPLIKSIKTIDIFVICISMVLTTITGLFCKDNKTGLMLICGVVLLLLLWATIGRYILIILQSQQIKKECGICSIRTNLNNEEVGLLYVYGRNLIFCPHNPHNEDLWIPLKKIEIKATDGMKLVIDTKKGVYVFKTLKPEKYIKKINEELNRRHNPTNKGKEIVKNETNSNNERKKQSRIHKGQVRNRRNKISIQEKFNTNRKKKSQK